MKRFVQRFKDPGRLARSLVYRVWGQFLPAQSEARIAKDAAQFWGESEMDGNQKTRDLSHWLGEGRWADHEAWQRIGQRHFQMFEHLSILTNTPRPIRRMVEWGPGGGANAVSFCDEASEFYGIDISEANLAECERRLKQRGATNFHPILINASRPDQCLKQLASPIDFFLSTAVFQHFPGKDYGVEVARIACRLLGNRGIALIQTRYCDSSRSRVSKRRNYRGNVLSFTSYTIDEFWRICIKSGFTPLAVILEPQVDYAYYLLQKER